MKATRTILFALVLTLAGATAANATTIGTDVSVSGNLAVTGNSTTTNATTTDLFATTASSTNLFGAGLSQCETSGSSALTWNAGRFGCNSISGGGSGTVNSGTAGQIGYYLVGGTALSGTSTIFIGPSEKVGISTSSPLAAFDVYGTTTLGTNYANYLQFSGATTGNGPEISALGTDTNVPLVLVPKASSAASSNSSGNVAINSGAIPSALQTWHNGGNPTPFDLVINQKSGNAWSGESMISIGNGAISSVGTSAAWPYIEMAKMGGTSAAPTAVSTSWLLGELAVLGYNGATFDADALMDFVTTATNARSGQMDLSFAVNGASPSPGAPQVWFNGSNIPINASISTPNNTTYGNMTNSSASGAAGWRGTNDGSHFVEFGMGGSSNTNALLAGSGYMLSDTGGLSFSALGSNPIRFATNGLAASNERMRVDGGGNIGIATTTPSQKLDVNGSVNIEGSTNGIIMHDTATANCYLVQVTNGALALTSHACQ